MKITDKGLEQILSLGLAKPTEIPGVFKLYSWKTVNYYGGLELSKNSFTLDGLYITLSEQQLKKIPVAKTQTSKNDDLIEAAKLFETVVILHYNSETNSLKAVDQSGQNNSIANLDLSLEDPSPFTIVKDTLKEFHGNYSPLPPCEESLKNAYVETSNLWISLAPIVKDGVFKGAIAGFANNREYGLDALDCLHKCALKAA